MKKLLLLLLTSSIFFAAQAQIHKVFVTKDGVTTDSLNSEYYYTYQKVADSSWKVEQFSMKNFMYFTGNYKDENLSMPYGKFTYYDFTTYQKDTVKYIQATRFYNNGRKNGLETAYFPDGYVSSVSTYVNDTLDGPFQSYQIRSKRPLAHGTYRHGLKEGDWDWINIEGTLAHRDTYHQDKLIKSKWFDSWKLSPNVYTTENYNFKYFVTQNMLKLINDSTKGYIRVKLVINKEGNLTQPIITRDGGKREFDSTFDGKVLEFLARSKPWNPSYNKKTKEPFEQNVTLIIIVDKRRNIRYNIERDIQNINGPEDNSYRN